MARIAAGVARAGTVKHKDDEDDDESGPQPAARGKRRIGTRNLGSTEAIAKGPKADLRAVHKKLDNLEAQLAKLDAKLDARPAASPVSLSRPAGRPG